MNEKGGASPETRPRRGTLMTSPATLGAAEPSPRMRPSRAGGLCGRWPHRPQTGHLILAPNRAPNPHKKQPLGLNLRYRESKAFRPAMRTYKQLKISNS
jgi:hypothetical protein